MTQDTPQPPPYPEGLGERGRQLWGALLLEGKVAGSSQVVAEEACRLADRLEKLDRLLRGDLDTWLSLREYDDGRPTELVIDKAAAESRACQSNLKLLLDRLDGAAAGGKGKPVPTTTPTTTGGASGVDQVAERRARRTKTAGPAQA